MNRQHAFLVAALMAMVALGCHGQPEPGSAEPAPDHSNRFQKVNLGTLPDSSFIPRSRGATVETFIVELAGDPVALVQAQAGGNLSASAKTMTRTSLATAQAGVESAVQALGGTVKARYRDAYNGLRVRIS